MISILQNRTVPTVSLTSTASSAKPNNLTRALHLEDLPARLIEVAIIILISILLYQFAKLVVRRIVAHQIDEEDPLVRRLREQRVQTLGALFTNVLLVVVVTVSVLTVLGVFINIAPLLASVSVVGLAVSFGAQTLVKDVISGTFMLIEGQFGIGDVVKIGETSGMVEKITLRTTILRDLYGAVHIIPNGDITRVSNLTKTWSRAVIDVGVAYREDVDRVLSTLRHLGDEFHANPEWGQLLLEPPQVLGIESLGESSVTVRMTAKTLPLKQWDVARELRRLIKRRFDQEGIEIPYPHLTFYWGENQMPKS
jgi:small-conductance mechanosensitive channel